MQFRQSFFIQMAVELPKHAKGERPYFFDDPAVDKLLAMLLAMAGELSVLRDRQDTLERIIEEKGLISRLEVESYEPDKNVIAERDAQREEYLKQILRIVDVEISGMGKNDLSDEWQQVIDQVSKEA